METGWQLFFFASHWLFIGLIYLALFIVVLAVRREMGQRLAVSSGPAPAETPGRLRLLQSGSDSRVQPGVLLPLAQQTTIGADKANDLVFADQYLSGQHVRLRWDGAGWWVEDLDSRNGTYVDGRPCPPHRPQPLPFGARLEMGDMAFELVE
jgi:pSer/pThr/pTyr-binding forkhead associated (FHA) protein